MAWFGILNDRLVLPHNQKAWTRWQNDVPGNRAKAGVQWPDPMRRKAKPT